MTKRRRLRKATKKPFKAYKDGKFLQEVNSPEEFENILRGIDRRKHKVVLR